MMNEKMILKYEMNFYVFANSHSNNVYAIYRHVHGDLSYIHGLECISFCHHEVQFEDLMV
jgi:hypothetical protein